MDEVAGTASKPPDPHSKDTSRQTPSDNHGEARPHVQSFLALTALGVVFGDIGTSPLYTFSTALNATGHPPTTAEVLGIVSLTFWALMILITVKYVTFVLRADNDGEGGILALLSLVERDEGGAQRVKLPFVVLLGVIGAALLYGDGVITPAISVLSAIEGLKFSPGAAQFVVPATLVILIALFAIQYRGTGSVGRLFGPVMVIWFLAIGILGLVNIVQTPEILWAFNPMAAIRFAVESPLTLFVVLGGVFLALTGGEALYADMGHVGTRAIRQAWFGLVFPALILSYFGQGAHVLVDPTAVANPFYSLAPSWALIPMVVLATLATIIASQALISGVFSMTRQAIQMGLCPRSMIVPTSSDEAGQVYLPTANWLLMAGTHFGRGHVQEFGRARLRLWDCRLRHDARHHHVAVSGGRSSMELAACRGRSGDRSDRRHRGNFPCLQLAQDNAGRMVSACHRRGDRNVDAVLAERHIGHAPAVAGNVDIAARSLPRLCRRFSHRPRAGARRLAYQGRAWRFTDVDPPSPA